MVGGNRHFYQYQKRVGEPVVHEPPGDQIVRVVAFGVRGEGGMFFCFWR